MSTLSNDVKFLTESVIIINCYVYQLNCYTNNYFLRHQNPLLYTFVKKKSHVLHFSKIEDQNCVDLQLQMQRPKPKS
jgi:hypothetical protein